MTNTTPYDPQVHKGYVLLVKQGKAHWVAPDRAAGFRGQGWKTVKEYEKVLLKRARKAAKNAPPVTTVADVIFNS